MRHPANPFVRARAGPPTASVLAANLMPRSREISGQAQRHHAAFVCIDVVGYSKMIAANTGDAVSILRDYNGRIIAPGICRYRGILVGRAGDNWLVEFASARTAVGFALHVQRCVRSADKMQLRIGIDFGEVIADDDILHGTGINIAVRLQEIARPGGIVLSAAILSRMGAGLPCELREMGARMLKNIPEPVWVYEVVMDAAEEQSPVHWPVLATSLECRDHTDSRGERE